MPTCPDGHASQATDFCDQCGLPIGEAPPPLATAVPETPTQPQVCPHCGAPKPADALFCESCGYDYTTGALPQTDLHTELGLTSATSTPPTSGDSLSESGDKPERPRAASLFADAHVRPEPTPDVSDAFPDAIPTGVLPKFIPHVAEIWIDPTWYAQQKSSDPLPPQGPPRIVPLSESALIGRTSDSRNIHPEIDCDTDSGVSRRQAYLTLAEGAWYINDLDSANGTFVAPSTQPPPEEPITTRTRVTPDSRIYVGAWTRIVVRPALDTD